MFLIYEISIIKFLCSHVSSNKLPYPKNMYQCQSQKKYQSRKLFSKLMACLPNQQSPEKKTSYKIIDLFCNMTLNLINKLLSRYH